MPVAGMLSSIDHVNLVVTDLPRMLAFYRDVLGLTVTKQVTISGDWIGKTVGLDDVCAEVVYLDLPEGPRIELLRYISPDAVHVARRRPAERAGTATPGVQGATTSTRPSRGSAPPASSSSATCRRCRIRR